MKDSRYLEERKHIQIPLTSAKTLSRESSAPKMNPPPATSSASASFFDPLSPSPSPSSSSAFSSSSSSSSSSTSFLSSQREIVSPKPKISLFGRDSNKQSKANVLSTLSFPSPFPLLYSSFYTQFHNSFSFLHLPSHFHALSLLPTLLQQAALDSLQEKVSNIESTNHHAADRIDRIIFCIQVRGG